MSLITELGLTMVGTIGVGFAIGYVIDSKSDKFPVFTITFLILGIFSGFWSVYKLIMKKIK